MVLLCFYWIWAFFSAQIILIFYGLLKLRQAFYLQFVIDKVR